MRKWFLIFPGGLLLILLAVLNWYRMSFYDSFLDEVSDSFQEARPMEQMDLSHLPSPVRRYLKYSGADQVEGVSRIEIHQSGSFRTWPQEEWFPLTASQFFTINPPTLHWYGEIKTMGGAIAIVARDRFKNGHGNMLIKLYSAKTLADAKGPEIDQGSLLRYMAEMMWFPMAMADPRLQWSDVTENSARVTMNVGEVSATGVFTFAGDGSLEKFEAERYFDDGSGKDVRPLPWGGKVMEYGERDGLKIPVHALVYWIVDGQEFAYGDLTIDTIEYQASLD